MLYGPLRLSAVIFLLAWKPYKTKSVKNYCFMPMTSNSRAMSSLGGLGKSMENYGMLVGDHEEHDFVATVNSQAYRVSVKTRKGWKAGWHRTSAIPRIHELDCPTHLLFVHLNDDYSIDRMWLYEWGYLLFTQRFKEHSVRGKVRHYIFNVDEFRDVDRIVYAGNTNSSFTLVQG
jgi:hypothetical protein